jgi:hypothetical protein
MIKTCSCCGRTFTPETWRTLAYVGPLFKSLPEDATEEERRAVLRNCTCKSTIAWVDPDPYTPEDSRP